MRQIRRQLRQLEDEIAKNAEDDEPKKKRQELIERRNQYELEVFEERAREYPTDMTVRYDLGLRHYRCGQIEKAIGAFQMSTRDPKRKILSLNMLGKCFFQSKLYQEAAAQFQAAIDSYEVEADAMWKELRYNLGLTYEAMKTPDMAIECYSQIVMADFQYRDAAKRLTRLRNRQEGHGEAEIQMSDSD
jgi:tetratricopeptide (TPR) repeat protein